MRSINRQGWQREQRDDLPLSEVLYVLWGRRRLVAGTVAALVLAALVFGLLRDPGYTAEAVVNVVPRGDIEEDPQVFLDEVTGAVTTEEGFLREVMRRAGWDAGPRAFGNRLEVQRFADGDEGTGLRVRFSAEDPEQATRAANAYARVFVERVNDLGESRLAGGALAADASVEKRASAPERASYLPLYVAVAVGVGLLVGGAAALLLEGRARLWRDARDAELTLRAPVLGVIPDYSTFEEKG